MKLTKRVSRKDFDKKASNDVFKDYTKDDLIYVIKSLVAYDNDALRKAIKYFDKVAEQKDNEKLDKLDADLDIKKRAYQDCLEKMKSKYGYNAKLSDLTSDEQETYIKIYNDYLKELERSF